MVHQEGDALGSVHSRDLKIPSPQNCQYQPHQHCIAIHYHHHHPLAILFLTRVHIALVSVQPRCPHELFSLIIFLSRFQSHTYLDFSRFTPSPARSCPSPASPLSPETFTLVLPSTAPQHQTTPTQICHVTPPTYSLFGHNPRSLLYAYRNYLNPDAHWILSTRLATRAPTILYLSFSHSGPSYWPTTLPHGLISVSPPWFVCLHALYHHHHLMCVYSFGVSIFRAPFPYSSPSLGNLCSAINQCFLIASLLDSLFISSPPTTSSSCRIGHPKYLSLE